LINRILELEIKRLSSPDGNENPEILILIFHDFLKRLWGALKKAIEKKNLE
jgi:hypothetical protein